MPTQLPVTTSGSESYHGNPNDANLAGKLEGYRDVVISRDLINATYLNDVLHHGGVLTQVI